MNIPVDVGYTMSEYDHYTDEKLLKDIEVLKAKVEAAGETVFMRMLHELQVYQMEHALQNRELREAQLELAATRGRCSVISMNAMRQASIFPLKFCASTLAVCTFIDFPSGKSSSNSMLDLPSPDMQPRT